MITVRFDAKEIASLRGFMSEDETRYSLCGVCVECTPHKAPMFVACNGRQLGAVQGEHTHDSTEVRNFIIPAVVVDHIALAGQCRTTIPFQCDYDPDSETLEFWLGDVQLKSRAVEAHYPAWRTVLPTPEPPRFEPSRLIVNREFLANIVEFFNVVSGPPTMGFEIFCNPDDAGPLIFKSPRALAVLMLMKADQSPTLFPFVR